MIRFFAVAVVLAALIVPSPNGYGQERRLTENEKIEAIVKRVEETKGAIFIRNDREYDAATAGKFLRGKWKANASDIETARDFIGKVATSSSTTGKAYRIRFRDGKERRSGEYLTELLKEIEQSATK